MFLLLRSVDWTCAGKTGLTESHFLSAVGVCRENPGSVATAQPMLSESAVPKGCGYSWGKSNISENILRFQSWAFQIRTKSDSPQIPCLYPSLLVPLPKCSRQTKRHLLLSARSVPCYGVYTGGPSCWQGGGRNILMPCFRVPGFSLSRGCVLPPQPPWLHSPHPASCGHKKVSSQWTPLTFRDLLCVI